MGLTSLASAAVTNGFTHWRNNMKLLDVFVATALGIALAVLALAYFDVLIK
jgi:hypothetical protein